MLAAVDFWKDCPIVQVDPENIDSEPTLRDCRSKEWE